MDRVDDIESVIIKSEVLLSESDEEKDQDESEDIDDPDVDDPDVDDPDVDDPDVDDPEKSRKKYKCTQPGCTARFLRPSRLTWHLRKHNDERPYKCNKEGCNRAYTNSSHLKRHQNTHGLVISKIYVCKECSLELGSLFSLNRHRRMVHDPDRLTCKQCGAKFRKKHCFTEHLSMHAGVMIYNCKVCKQEYSTLRLLKRHERTHDKRKTYPCKSSGCNEIFDKWSLLVKHVETTHQFEHKCKICEKRFKLKNQLSQHESIHKNEDIYRACPYENCPRYYSHKKNLYEHIETYHLGRRFYCDSCEKSFTSKASIIRHLKAIHESPQPAKKRKTPRKRKDTGLPKKSMASKLAGLELPYELEKRILHRKPKINLKQNTDCLVNLEKKDETKSSTPVNVTQVKMKMAFEKRVLRGKRKNDLASVTKNCAISEKKDENISSTCNVVTQETEITSEKRVLPGKRINVLENDTKSCVTRKKKKISSTTVNVPENDVKISEKPSENSCDVQKNTEKEISLLAGQEVQEEKNEMPLLANESLPKEAEILPEKSPVVPEQTEEEISQSADSLLRTGKLIVMNKDIKESFVSFEQINEDISILRDALLHNDMEIMLKNFFEKSPNEEENKETKITESSNVSKKNVEESYDVSEKMDLEVSLLAANLHPKNSSKDSDNHLQNSLDSPDLLDKRISPSESSMNGTKTVYSKKKCTIQ